MASKKAQPTSNLNQKLCKELSKNNMFYHRYQEKYQKKNKKEQINRYW